MPEEPIVTAPQHSAAAQQNYMEEYEEYLAGLPPVYGRKLLFSEKCGIAYALYKGERAEVICKAFGLSRATVSWLAHCLQPGRTHYAEVWREWQTLGEEKFREKHFTHALYWRLTRVRCDLTHLGEGTDVAVKKSGPDARARKYSFDEIGWIEIDDNRWRIDHTREAPAGWYVTREKAPDVHYGAERIHGREEPEPFVTSSLAFDGLYQICGYPSPRPKPGRPKK